MADYPKLVVQHRQSILKRPIKSLQAQLNHLNTVIERLSMRGGVDFPLITLSRRLEETPDMYIFLKSSDVALSRGTHFSYASSSQLRATGPQTFCLILHHSKLIGTRTLKKYRF